MFSASFRGTAGGEVAHAPAPAAVVPVGRPIRRVGDLRFGIRDPAEGVAMVNGQKSVKPWPDDIDNWNHHLHGAGVPARA